MNKLDQKRKASRRERKGAKELLRIGQKVWLYRKDKLPAIEERALQIANTALYDALKDKTTTADLLE